MEDHTSSEKQGDQGLSGLEAACKQWSFNLKLRGPSSPCRTNLLMSGDTLGPSSFSGETNSEQNPKTRGGAGILIGPRGWTCWMMVSVPHRFVLFHSSFCNRISLLELHCPASHLEALHPRGRKALFSFSAGGRYVGTARRPHNLNSTPKVSMCLRPSQWWYLRA